MARPPVPAPSPSVAPEGGVIGASGTGGAGNGPVGPCGGPGVAGTGPGGGKGACMAAAVCRSLAEGLAGIPRLARIMLCLYRS